MTHFVVDETVAHDFGYLINFYFSGKTQNY